MNTIFNVKNRSAGVTGYAIPEMGIRRSFAPGEVKQIPAIELEKLTYQPGGMTILAQFLQIMDEAGIQMVGLRTEPEYNMNENDVIKLLLSGSVDQFLDCLDFAPIGVIDLIKTLSVKLPLTDFAKRQALKAKTGFDVDAALKHVMEEKEDDGNAPFTEVAKQRRVQKEEPQTGRRASTPKYNVVASAAPATEVVEEKATSKIKLTV